MFACLLFFSICKVTKWNLLEPLVMETLCFQSMPYSDGGSMVRPAFSIAITRLHLKGTVSTGNPWNSLGCCHEGLDQLHP